MKAILTSIAGISLFLTGSNLSASDLTIDMTGFRNDKGNIAIALYKDAKSFKDNNIVNAPYTMLFTANGSKNLTLHNIPAGQYAISILHDENRNGTIDTTSRGFPTEGYAYSNNVGKLYAPSFKDAAFSHTADADTKQTLKILYVK